MAMSIDELRKLSQQKARQQDQFNAAVAAGVSANANAVSAPSLNTQSAQIASRLDNPINSPSATAARNRAVGTQSANIINRLNTGAVTPSSGRQAQIVQAAKDYKSAKAAELVASTMPPISSAQQGAQIASRLDNSLMGQATRDKTKAQLESAAESLYNQMEIARSSNNNALFTSAQNNYNLIISRLDDIKKNGGSLVDKATANAVEQPSFVPLSAAEIHAIGRDATAWNNRLSAIESQIPALHEQVAAYDRLGMTAEMTAAQAELEKLYSEKEQLERQISSTRQMVNLSEQANRGAEYNALMNADDFEEYAEKGASVYVPSREAAGKSMKSVDKLTDNPVKYYRDNWDSYAKLPYSSYTKEAVLYHYMTDDEFSIYNYLLGKEGKDAANEYLDFIREELNIRAGKAEGEAVNALPGVLKAPTAAAYSVAAGVEQFGRGLQQLTTDERLPTSKHQAASQTIQDDLGEVGKTLYGVGVSVGNMLPSIVISVATGGLGASGAVASAIGSASMGLSSSGNAYNAALQEGYTKDQARTYAALVGGSEATLQYLLGGIGSLGGVTDDVLLAKVAGIDNAFARIAATGAIKIGSEVTEEEIQLLLEPAFRSLIFETDYDAPTWEEVAETAIMTALSTGLLEAPGVVVSEANRQNNVPQTVESVMPTLPEQQKTTQPTGEERVAQVVRDLTGQTEKAPANTTPTVNPAPVAEYRQTASDILDSGVFDSPTYGEALQETGMKRADVRQALRKIAQNTPGAALDYDVQTVIGAIQTADAKTPTPVQTEHPEAVSELRTEQPAEAPVVRSGEPEAQPAMGAADYGFSGEIGSWKRDAADFVKDTEIPKYDKDGNPVSDHAGTMFSMNVPKETKEAVERLSYEGELSVSRDTNKEQVDRVHRAIEKDGFDAVYERTVAEVMDGKSSADLTASLGVLMVQAANRHQDDKAATLIKLMRRNSTNTAQAFQAMSAYYKLTPQGRLLSMEKSVERINAELSASNKGGTKRGGLNNRVRHDAAKAIDDARETALRDMENGGTGAGDGKKTSTETRNEKNKKRNHGVEVENWMQEVGKEVARALDSKPKPQTPKPISRIIRQDILKLARSHWPQAPKENATRRTAADTITDFFANKEKYVEAWNAALEEYRRIHGLGEDFVGATGSGSEPVMLQAIVDEAASQDLKKQKIELLSYLGDRTSIEKQLSEGLIKRTGATGENADMVRRAVSGYVSSVMHDASIERIGRGLDKDIQSVVEKIGGSMYEIVRDNKGNKAGAAKIVANMMIKQYGISKSAAQAASVKIVDRFNSIITEKTQKALDAMFGEHKGTKKKSAVQKITEMENLGAFGDERYQDAAAKKADDLVDAEIAKAVKAIGAKTANIIRSNKSDRSAVANQVKDMLMKDHRLHKEDAEEMSEFILKRFDAVVAARSETALKAMFKDRPERVRKTTMERFRELANMGAFYSPDYAEKAMQKLFDEPVQIPASLVTEYLNAKTPDEIRTIEEEIYKKIGEQIPSNFRDKWNAWRHMSMLGNFKSPGRNFIGNAAGQVMRAGKNIFKSLGEAAFVDKSKRTTPIIAAGEAYRSVAKDDIKNVEMELEGVGKYSIANDQIQKARQIFRPRVAEAVRKVFPDLPEAADNVSIEGLRKLVGTAMSDQMFSHGTYVDALAGFIKARGYKAEDFTNGKMSDSEKADARAYAISEALKATYRDLNTLTELVTSVRFNPNTAKKPISEKAMRVANAGLEGIMPYLKTPANVLARGIEYDPILGTVTTIIKAADAKSRGELNASEVLDDVSKVLTGTTIMLAGYFMRANNLLKGSSDDEEQDRLERRNEYAVTIGGKSIPIDWMAPFCMPLFVGAELYDLIDKRGTNGAPMTSKIGSSITAMSSALLNTSMLDGLQDMIDNVKYADQPVVALVANAALGYLGQAVPTIFGQIERAANSPYRESTFVDESNTVFGADWQRALGTLSKKIPGWDYNQIPNIDRWGRVTDNGGVGERIWDNLFNPANTTEIIETEVDKEIKQLEQQTGKNLTPPKAESTITVDGSKIILTADEFLTYAQAKGQNALTFEENLMNSDAYDSLDANAKYRAHKLAQSLADTLAIDEAGFEQKEATAWHLDLIGADADTITQTLIEHAIANESEAMTGNKYLGFSNMLENKIIDDQLALALMTDDLRNAYTENLEGTGITVQQFLDVYGTAQRDGKTKDEKRQIAEDMIRGMDIDDPEVMGTFIYAMQEAMPVYIPMENKVSNQTLLDIGDIGRIESQMGEEQREKYDKYIKNSGIEMQTYLDLMDFYSSDEAKAKKDKNGDTIDGESRQDHVIAYIKKLKISNKQKGKLFCSLYAEKNCPAAWR